MKAEIITIGDEILIGQIVDTNSAWIAERLNDIGVRVLVKMSVADDRAAIADAVTDALNSADIVILTGGLGPTKDDITKKTLAELFGCGMVEHRPTYERNEKTIAARGFEYNALNRAQAMVPECCEAILNMNGTAPGMWFDRGSKVVVSLPGVPFEMRYLMDEEIVPRLLRRFRLGGITHKTMITFGYAEAMLAEMIAPWEDALPPHIKLAYLPAPGGIRLRFSAYETDETQAHAEIDAQFAELEKMIPEYVVGYGDTTVQSAVAGMLAERGKTLSVAESCTGGAIASRFTAMAGASRYFLCGMVAYSNASKINILGVNQSDIEQYGAVSEQVAEQMALGVRRISGSDYAIATTGIAGPDGGTEDKPVGTVWIAIAHPDGVLSRQMRYGNLREQNIDRASAAAINMLRLVLNG